MTQSAQRTNMQDDFYGTVVPDPYRWLEDPTAEETLAFVAAQNAQTQAYLEATGLRPDLQARLLVLQNYPKWSAPIRRDGFYFFTMNTGLQNQAVTYVQDGLAGEPRVVIDPNMLSADGTASLTTQSFSRDGAWLAYGVSHSGSDWQQIHLRHVADGSELPETIDWCRYALAAWVPDGSGFYYARFPAADEVAPEDRTNYSRVYWHTLNTPQSADALIYSRPDAKELSFTPTVTEDGAYLVLRVFHGTDAQNRFYYRPLASEDDFVRLLDDADAGYHFIGNTGPIFYFWTTLDAPRGRIIAIDTAHPQRSAWRELVPEDTDPISQVALVQDQFIVLRMHDAHDELHRYALDGAPLGAIPLQGLGAVIELSGKSQDDDLFFSFTSFLQPPTIYRYDFAADAVTPWQGPELPFDCENYETEQVFYPSKDGTRIPMFLTHKKGLVRDGNNLTLLYGYGGFNIPLTPFFAPNRLAWLERGGIFAVANLRGGSEYGEEWHMAGMLEKKQNVFDDFIAAAEWLIAERYTRTPRLAIEGGSNGGLLVAACEVQRPDLFGAVLCRVPLIDMLRYHRFTIGRYWIGEYGNADCNPEHFRFLYAYSPLHQVQPDTSFPPTLIMSADTDDRVVPAHAKKFAATLQWANAGPNPILLRVEMKAGHGVGKPTAKLIEEQTDMLAFLLGALGA